MRHGTTMCGCAACVLVGAIGAQAQSISAGVAMSNRFYVDADPALNAAHPWPGTLPMPGSGPGTFDYSLFSRIYNLGPLVEQWQDSLAYLPAPEEHLLADAVGVHRWPQGLLRAGDPNYPWDPDNPGITSLAMSEFRRAAGRLHNEFGDAAGWHRGEVYTKSWIKPNSTGHLAEANGWFIDHSTFSDNSDDDGQGYRARRMVHESWGYVESTVDNPFARELSHSSWDNLLELSVRDPTGHELLAGGYQSERWATQGLASVTWAQGVDHTGAVYPDPQGFGSLKDPREYVSTLRLEGIIIDPDDRPALNEDHYAFLSMGPLYQELGEIFPDDPLLRFDGMVQIVNGDFLVTGDFAPLDWRFETIPSDIPGYDMLVAMVDFQTPWGSNMDFDSIFGGVSELEIGLTTTQYWHTFAVPAPATWLLGIAAIGLVSPRPRR